MSDIKNIRYNVNARYLAHAILRECSINSACATHGIN